VWFAGELVGMTRAGAIYQIDNDHVGRPELITNANKTIVWQSNNSPFGGMTPTTNTFGEFNIGFPGQYFDAESNYWYNMNRYYVPAIGRYLQADPIGLAGGLNPYPYVASNPSNMTDPLGFRADTDLCTGLTPGQCMAVGSLPKGNLYLGADGFGQFGAFYASIDSGVAADSKGRFVLFQTSALV
jgi:RHS repeat-associated protein